MSGEANFSEKYSEEESILNPIIIRNGLNLRQMVLIDSSGILEG